MVSLGFKRMKLDYLQLSMLASAYFILNYEDMAERKGRYMYDFSTTLCDESFIINAVYCVDSQKAKGSSFWFEVLPEDADLEVRFVGSFDEACRYAQGIIDDYVYRAKK